MPVLSAKAEEREAKIAFEPGKTVRQLLETTDCRVQAGCSGNSACGLCRIRAEGDANPPTPIEELYFGKDGLALGLRLACQVVPEGDVTIDVLNPAPDDGLRVLGEQDFFLPPTGPATASCENRPLGVAVDVGTTNVTLSVWDLTQGRRLGGRCGLNRQARFGADVLTRVTAACESDERGRELQRLALESIGEALHDVLLCEGRRTAEIGRIVLAGNTAQLSLLSRKNTRLLLDPAWWGRALDCVPDDLADWCTVWGIPADARMDVLPPVAGWVGSDVLAGVLATGMPLGEAPSLLIDFGTNSEMALWDGLHVWMTSAAGGPAFEGCGLSCGMPAVRGAVYAVESGASKGAWSVRTVGDTPARGLCGSGLVDLVAVLRRTGALDAAGRFSGVNEQGFCMDVKGMALTLTKRDVDMFQRAKSAIATGVQVLSEASDCADLPIKTLFVCGAFGKYLNVDNAQQAGLLPRLDKKQVRLCGNTSVAGCELLLNGHASREYYSALQHGAKLINMCDFEEFDDYFMNNLFLEPFE